MNMLVILERILFPALSHHRLHHSFRTIRYREFRPVSDVRVICDAH